MVDFLTPLEHCGTEVEEVVVDIESDELVVDIMIVDMSLVEVMELDDDSDDNVDDDVVVVVVGSSTTQLIS